MASAGRGSLGHRRPFSAAPGKRTALKQRSPALKGQEINAGCFAGRVTSIQSFGSTLPLVLASHQTLMGACKRDLWNILIYLATGQTSSLPPRLWWLYFNRSFKQARLGVFKVVPELLCRLSRLPLKTEHRRDAAAGF